MTKRDRVAKKYVLWETIIASILIEIETLSFNTPQNQLILNMLALHHNVDANMIIQ